jgi:uncharacterized protein (TIGR00251 family)
MVIDTADGAIIDIKVIPRAGRTAVDGTRDNAVLVRLAAAPVDGAANAELIALLARLLDIPKRQLTVVAGEKARAKRVKAIGVRAATVIDRLRLALPANGR